MRRGKSAGQKVFSWLKNVPLGSGSSIGKVRSSRSFLAPSDWSQRQTAQRGYRPTSESHGEERRTLCAPPKSSNYLQSACQTCRTPKMSDYLTSSNEDTQGVIGGVTNSPLVTGRNHPNVTEIRLYIYKLCVCNPVTRNRLRTHNRGWRKGGEIGMPLRTSAPYDTGYKVTLYYITYHIYLFINGLADVLAVTFGRNLSVTFPDWLRKTKTPTPTIPTARVTISHSEGNPQ